MQEAALQELSFVKLAAPAGSVQGVQVLVFPAEYEPAGQGEHDAAAAPEKVLAAQLEQVDAVPPAE